MSDPQAPATETAPTNLLLSSNKVDGTKVVSRDGDSLGSVHSFMVNKA